MTMNQRDRDALDRHITGNYGEDQLRDEFVERLMDDAQKVHDEIHRGDGTVHDPEIDFQTVDEAKPMSSDDFPVYQDGKMVSIDIFVPDGEEKMPTGFVLGQKFTRRSLTGFVEIKRSIDADDEVTSGLNEMVSINIPTGNKELSKLIYDNLVARGAVVSGTGE